jgi:hypothetical protein
LRGKDAEREFAASLQAFTLRRAELVSVLSARPLEDWSRTVNIAGRRHSSSARRAA